jgi:hypothetical protein
MCTSNVAAPQTSLCTTISLWEDHIHKPVSLKAKRLNYKPRNWKFSLATCKSELYVHGWVQVRWLVRILWVLASNRRLVGDQWLWLSLRSPGVERRLGTVGSWRRGHTRGEGQDSEWSPWPQQPARFIPRYSRVASTLFRFHHHSGVFCDGATFLKSLQTIYEE